MTSLIASGKENKMDRYLLLLAEVHNWGFKCAPCWESTTWRVFSDRSYVVESQYTRKPDKAELQRITSYAQLIITKRKRGKMRMSSFEKMLATMETEPWRTPGFDIQACDGEGWRIEMNGPNGAVIRSSGELGYIYGEQVLEAIASLLPGSR